MLGTAASESKLRLGLSGCRCGPHELGKILYTILGVKREVVSGRLRLAALSLRSVTRPRYLPRRLYKVGTTKALREPSTPTCQARSALRLGMPRCWRSCAGGFCMGI